MSKIELSAGESVPGSLPVTQWIVLGALLLFGCMLASNQSFAAAVAPVQEDGSPLRIEFNQSSSAHRTGRPWEEHLTHHGVLAIAFSDPLIRMELLKDERFHEFNDLLQQFLSQRYDLQQVSVRSDLTEEDIQTRAVQLSQLYHEYEELFKAQLSSEEIARLSELQLWRQVGEHGLTLLLCQSNLGKRLSVTAQQRLELIENAHRQAERIKSAVKEIEQQTIDHLVEVLSDSQQDRLHELIDAPQDKVVCRDVRLDHLATSLTYSKDFTADIRRLPGGVEPWDDCLLPSYTEGLTIGYQLHDRLTAEVVDWIEFTPNQRRELNEYLEQVETEIARLRRSYDSQSGSDDGRRDRFLRHTREVRQKTEQQLLEQILSPSQEFKLLQVKYRALIRKHGPLALLTDGTLGQRCDVSRRQRQDLFDRAIETAEFLDQEHAALHDAVDQSILEILERDQREDLRNMLGVAPSISLRGDATTRVRKLRFAPRPTPVDDN